MKDKLRENIESLVVAVALALIIRASVVEAFVVPSGSMAPTIYGKHVEVACDTCGFKLALGMEKGENRKDRPASIECPVCHKTTDVGFHDYSAGDRLLVNKFVHKMKGLARWEIIVFRCPDPEKEGKNYIKRLVGLPGESIRVWNGDLYINGKIEKKPFNVQKSMWIKVSANDFRDDLWKSLWSIHGAAPEVENGTLWLAPVDSLKLNYIDDVGDVLLYNTLRRMFDADEVGDLNLVLEAEIPDGSGIFVDLSRNGSRFRFVVRSGQGKSSIADSNGSTVWEGSLDLRPGRHVVECWNVDSALYLVVDGKLRADFEYSLRDTGAYFSADIAFGAVEGQAGFRRATLYRDIYYCTLRGSSNNYGVHSTYRLSKKSFDPSTGKKSENEYFMLGDNSRSSSDSREWGSVNEGRIRGKVVVRFWPPRRIGIIR